jgi:hypothetical protein
MVAMRRANEPDVSDAHPGMELDSASALWKYYDCDYDCYDNPVGH